jgi:hypothetical protein
MGIYARGAPFVGVAHGQAWFPRAHWRTLIAQHHSGSAVYDMAGKVVANSRMFRAAHVEESEIEAA